MSRICRFRTTMLGLAAVGSLVLGGSARAQETDQTLTLARVPAFDRQVVAAQQALRSGDLGSMQEEALLAMMAASTAPVELPDAGTVTARRVLAAQHALASADLGSMQEEALSALVAAGGTNDAVEVGRDALLLNALSECVR